MDCLSSLSSLSSLSPLSSSHPLVEEGLSLDPLSPLSSDSSRVVTSSLVTPPIGARTGYSGPPLSSSPPSSSSSSSSSSSFSSEEPLHFSRVQMDYVEASPVNVREELAEASRLLLEALVLRKSLVFRAQKRDEREFDIRSNPPFIEPDPDVLLRPFRQRRHRCFFDFHEGVAFVWEEEEEGEGKREGKREGDEDKGKVKGRVFRAPSRHHFALALSLVMKVAGSGPLRSFCFNRLYLLESRFQLHQRLNCNIESIAQRAVKHRDFYNIRRVDNHVHHSACMNQKHLLRFIKATLKKRGDEVVIVRDGQELTLKQVFESLNLTPYDLSVDTLDLHADNTFHRFDKFNAKYSPIGESRLREIFLKYNNLCQGRHLAELTKEVIADLEANKYTMCEYRLSIYGLNYDEWTVLAHWICSNNLFHYNVRWMIQIPRLYSTFKSAGKIDNFGQMLRHIFEPLFQVSIDPCSNPELHCFLTNCVGIDIVDDESLREKSFSDRFPAPNEYNGNVDPPYAYFAYYIYANLHALNQLRDSKGMTTFAFRPHAGESGDIEHLCATFLLARSINHGIMLAKSPSIQYLYYLAQVGISMSPLSNNLLFLEFSQSPFPKFFARGLNVTLSTDDPLQIHLTKEPLVEEYAVACQVWKLFSVDLCEIARNSVLQSGWEHEYKVHFLGNNYWLRGIKGNDIRQTNVPSIRTAFRHELLTEEFRMLSSYSAQPFSEDMIDPL